VQVLEPKELILMMKNQLQQTLSLYENPSEDQYNTDNQNYSENQNSSENV
jgi:hypothetical protein